MLLKISPWDTSLDTTTISKLVLTAKYEGAFSKDQREFIDNNTNTTVKYDSRPSLLIFGVGYNLEF